MEIEEILEKLFGNVAPVCEINEDNRRLENLELYKKATKFFINELIESAKWKNDYRYSAKQIGEETYDFLKLILEDLECVIDLVDTQELMIKRQKE